MLFLQKYHYAIKHIHHIIVIQLTQTSALPSTTRTPSKWTDNKNRSNTKQRVNSGSSHTHAEKQYFYTTCVYISLNLESHRTGYAHRITMYLWTIILQILKHKCMITRQTSVLTMCNSTLTTSFRPTQNIYMLT